MEDLCFVCGAIIPEGRMVCRRCEVMAEEQEELLRMIQREKRREQDAE